MADQAPDQNVNWHTWVSSLVNTVVIAVVGAVATYITTHQTPPTIPAPVVNVQPAVEAKPAPTMPTEEQVKLWLDAHKKGP